MLSVTTQAIRLELGDLYEEYYARTTSYVKGLIGKGWWADTTQLLNCEGPLSKMVDHCLVYVIEEADRIEGYKAYTSYLTNEYGTTKNHNLLHDWVDDNTLAKEGSSSSLTSIPYEHLVQTTEALYLDESEVDFLYAHQKMGMHDTAELFGMTHEEGWKHYRRLKAKIRHNA